jgi:hypothetical protein
MGVLIVAGTVTLVVLIVQRVGGLSGGAAWEAALAQPPGTRIAGMAAGEGGVAVWLQGPEGERVMLVDPKRGKVLGVIRPGQ